jgi:hypothetical protein
MREPIPTIGWRFWVGRDIRRNMMFDGDTFERGGRSFKVEFPYDYDIATPWVEHDGHGPVREARFAHECNKAPGERVLHSDRRSYRYYDFQEATRIAKRDGWGVSWDDRRAFALKHWRQPTRKEIVRMAVERDFDYLRRWCNDQWFWCSVHVECLDEEDEVIADRWLGRLESDDYEGQVELAYELADEINHELDEAQALEDERAAREQEAERPDMYGE